MQKYVTEYSTLSFFFSFPVDVNCLVPVLDTHSQTFVSCVPKPSFAEHLVVQKASTRGVVPQCTTRHIPATTALPRDRPEVYFHAALVVA
jgi:hypothetical protein